MNLPQLTVTRFVAALGIVIFHLGQHTWPFSILPVWTGFLSMAVGYFFALSGFILVIAQVRDGQLPGSVAASRFYVNRVARIYPLYLLALLAWVAFNLVSRHPSDTVELDEVGANATLLQSWLPGYAITCNFPGWSLSVEAFFYAVFPLLFARLPRDKGVLGISLAVLGLCLLGSYASVQALGTEEWPSFLPPLHLGTFMLGMATGFLFVRYHAAWLGYRWGIRIAGVAGLAAAMIWLHGQDGVAMRLAHGGLLAPLYLLIVVGLALTTQPRPVLARSILPWLGEISYGLYILHIPLAMYTFGIAARLSRMAGGDPLWYQLAMLTAAAALCYQFVEVPARKLIRSRKSPPPLVEVEAERAIGLKP